MPESQGGSEVQYLGALGPSSLEQKVHGNSTWTQVGSGTPISWGKLEMRGTTYSGGGTDEAQSRPWNRTRASNQNSI